MVNDELYLCSDLIRVSSSESDQIGALELISPKGCTLALQTALPDGTPVKLQCMDCPQGKKSCTECKFNGRVQGHRVGPLLGNSTHVEFEGRTWSAAEWQPRHLLRTRDDYSE